MGQVHCSKENTWEVWASGPRVRSEMWEAILLHCPLGFYDIIQSVVGVFSSSAIKQQISGVNKNNYGSY